MKSKIIYQNQISPLTNMLMVAAEKFRENAKTFAACAATGGNPMITPTGAQSLAEEFTRMAEEASTMCQLFGAAEHIEITYDPEMVEDDEPAPRHKPLRLRKREERYGLTG